MAARTDKETTRIWRGPSILAALSLVGLVAALLVDGPADLVWGLLIALPLIAILIFFIRSKPQRRS